MRNSLLILVFLCLSSLPAFSQHETDNWFFGYHAGITFQNGWRQEIQGGQTNTREGTAVISDKTTGDLLFYTDGMTVWNNQHRIMVNGIGLKGGVSCTQSALIVPNPANPLQYYVFTAPDLTPGTGITALYYSIVSLELPGGKVMNKNTLLIDGVSEKLTGTMDCAGTGFWVVTHHKQRSEFYSFHITVSGIDTRPVVSTYSGEISDYTLGYMKISPSRTKLALASGTNGGYLSLFDFNAGTGMVKNCTVIYNNIGTNVYTYGLAFSPDNSKLYSTRKLSANTYQELVQYDISLQDAESIRNSVVKLYPYASNVAMQLAFGGSIFISGYENTPTTFFDVIGTPNKKGVACNYINQAFSLNNTFDSGLPNFMDYNFNQTYRSSDTIVVCPNGSVQLGRLPDREYTYSWTPTEGLDDPNISNPIASPTQTTEYQLKKTNGGGCDNYEIYTVKVNSVKAEIAPITPLCSRKSVKLSASGGDSYEWSPIDSLDNPKKATPVASPKVSTRYKVVITRGDCKDSAYVDVVVFKIAASKDTVICGGSSVQLSASGGDTYLWYPSIGLDNPLSATPIASPSVTTKYRVLVSNANCVDSAFVTVTVKPFTGADAGIDKTVCLGVSTELGAPPDTSNTYTWRPSINLDDVSKANPTVTPTSNGTTQYILTVASKNGCIAYDTILVTAGSITAKVSSDTTMCLGSSVQLIASGGSDYEWTPTTGLDNPNIPNPIATPSETTTYKVRVSSGSKCEDFASVTVTVNPFPTANAGIDLSSCRGERLQLGAPLEVGNTYSWQPPIGLDDPTKSNPIASPTVTTEYILTVTNSSGCSSKDTVLITVGNIKAIVSKDTAVCAGSSVQLSASGGTTYKWAPIDGLDNPNSATPLCTVSTKTKYKVVISSGFCVDSAYVTVDIAQLPIANAGPDQSPCKGDPTQLGVSPQDGNIYTWQPPTGLDNPTISNPIATPNETTQYILTVTNSTGCTSQDTVIVTMNPRNEYSFTLSPSVVTVIPGQQFQTVLNVPSGVPIWKVHLDYDDLIVKFGSIVQMSTGITVTSNEKNGKLSLDGTGENGAIMMNFYSFLPYTSDTNFVVKLNVDSASIEPCETVTSKGNTLELGMFCGRKIRTVSSTGKNYFITTKENGVNFGVGLPGNVRVELYDYTGTFKEIVMDGNMEAGEYSIDFDMPTGVYFCRINSGMYSDVRKVAVVQ